MPCGSGSCRGSHPYYVGIKSEGAMSAFAGNGHLFFLWVFCIKRFEKTKDGCFGNAAFLSDRLIRHLFFLAAKRKREFFIEDHRRASRAEIAFGTRFVGLTLIFKASTRPVADIETVLLSQCGKKRSNSVFEIVAGIQVRLSIGTKTNPPRREPMQQ